MVGSQPRHSQLGVEAQHIAWALQVKPVLHRPPCTKAGPSRDLPRRMSRSYLLCRTWRSHLTHTIRGCHARADHHLHAGVPRSDARDPIALAPSAGRSISGVERVPLPVPPVEQVSQAEQVQEVERAPIRPPCVVLCLGRETAQQPSMFGPGDIPISSLPTGPPPTGPPLARLGPDALRSTSPPSRLCHRHCCRQGRCCKGGCQLTPQFPRQVLDTLFGRPGAGEARCTEAAPGYTVRSDEAADVQRMAMGVQFHALSCLATLWGQSMTALSVLLQGRYMRAVLTHMICMQCTNGWHIASTCPC